MRVSILGLVLLFTCLSCSGEKTGKETSQNETFNFTENSTDSTSESTMNAELPHHITFDRKQVFSSTEKVIVGEFESFAVDEKNRVYIADMDQTVVHVFNPQGGYITSLGRQGKGPAEFTAITPKTRIKVDANRLYASDYADPSTFFPNRIQVFNLDDLSFSHTIKLIAKNRSDYQLKRYYPTDFFPRSNGKLLVSYGRQPTEYQDSTSAIWYVVQDSMANITQGTLLELNDQKNLVHLVEDVRVPYLAIYNFPFYSKSMLAVSKEGDLYVARTADFNIDVYDSQGTFNRSIHHAFDNKPFDKAATIDRYERTGYGSELGEGVALTMVQEADSLPQRWPAIETMFFDDEDQLWVSTIVNDNEVYEWWILKKTGAVVTKFDWPRDKPIRAIQNGRLYTFENDEKDVGQVVSYDIYCEELQ